MRKGLHNVRPAFALVTAPHLWLWGKASGAPCAICSTDTLSCKFYVPWQTGPPVRRLAGPWPLGQLSWCSLRLLNPLCLSFLIYKMETISLPDGVFQMVIKWQDPVLRLASVLVLSSSFRPLRVLPAHSMRLPRTGVPGGQRSRSQNQLSQSSAL